MAIILLTSLAYLAQVSAKPYIVDYRFYKNFGPIIHDYAGFGHIAYNTGNSIFTDRGAVNNFVKGYNSRNYFEFPPLTDGGAGPSLYPSMTIAFWSKSHEQNMNYFLCKTTEGSLLLYETTSINLKYGSEESSGTRSTLCMI